MQLTGFGVELAVKNMEYKAIDDSKVTEGGEGDVSGGENESATRRALSGFHFSALTELIRNGADGLSAFREELSRKSALASDARVETVGHQGFGTSSDATNRALGGSVDGARGVVAKFPKLANPLSLMKLNATMVKEVKANDKIVRPRWFSHVAQR